MARRKSGIRSGVCKDCGKKFEESYSGISIPAKYDGICSRCVEMRDSPPVPEPPKSLFKVKFWNLSWPIRIAIFFAWFILLVWLYAIFRMFW